MNKYIFSIIASLFVAISSSAQTLSTTEVKALLNQGLALFKEQNFTDALDIFTTVEKRVNHQQSETERQLYVSSQYMACKCYYFNKQYNDAYQVAKSLVGCSLTEDEKPEIYRYYVLSGYLTGAAFLRLDENDNCTPHKAREVFEELIPYADEQLKKYLLPRIPFSWYLEGLLCYGSEKFEEALECYYKALDGYRELKLTTDEISTLQNIASIKAHLDDIPNAIVYYEQALSLVEQSDDNVERMSIIKELYLLNGQIGNNEQQTLYAQQIEALYNSSQNIKVHYIYYIHKGKQAKNLKQHNVAEQWYLKALDVATTLASEGDDTILDLAQFELGELYHHLGRYDAAFKFLHLSLGDNSRISKQNYITYILIADIHLKNGEMEKCLEYMDKLFVLEPHIDEPRQLFKLYSLRGNYYASNNKNDLALLDYKKADAAMATKYSSSDSERADLYAIIGNIEHRLGHFTESEHYYTQYADAIKQLHGEHSLQYINAQIHLANVQGFANHIKEGCDNYTEAVNKLKNEIKRRLPYMNSVEREGFWTPLSSLLTLMTPYALKAELHQTEYAKTCYDALLLSKAFLLDSERSVYDVIKNEGDASDMQTYMSIATVNNNIKEWEKNFTQYSDSILPAYNRVAKLESSLMKRCKSIGDITSFVNVDYNAVKGALKRDDVLLDFTDYVSTQGDRHYAAYIVNKKQKYPLLKSLFTESQIESLGIVRLDLFYDVDYASDVIDLLWAPLEESIPEGATVYYVPSQMLFQVCLESLPLKDGTLLGEHYNFVRISSARELVKKNFADKLKASTAVLYGGLQYDLEPIVISQNADYSLMSVRKNTVLQELPYSKVEVETISDILKESNIDVKPYMGLDGTVESFLNLHGKSPHILHLATHGFYYTPAEAEAIDYFKGYNDAMSLSGLVMAGGNAVWSGEKQSGESLDGILSANDIAQIDLSKTDMVVLSACRSAQGNATAEGLYGLQRAFKKAGAGTMVMTLWNVNDKITAKFMTAFYKALPENNWNKHAAFMQAKLHIRSQHPSTDHWAAYVMLD